MGHHHNHHHYHGVTKGKKLGIAILLNVLITVAQVIGGFISGSLSLLSDALHNFSDVISLIISYLASRLTKKKATANKTFGYKRSEIMAAFINSATLIVVAVFLIVEAIKRFFDPQTIDSNLVIWLSVLAIMANGFSVFLIQKEAHTNMNMKSAYLHLLTDMMASIAVFVGGLLMKYFQIFWIDSLLTLLIALYLIYMGYDLLKESTKVLMLFAPKSIIVKDIVTEICKIEEVKNVHHVHIWQLNEEETHLEAHIDFTEDIKLSEFDRILSIIEEKAYHDFGINHVNIQPEFGKCDDKNIIVQD
ncbi:cation diffusion facilitator family transporter [Allomuricauda sp. d1]|uniref:cation diffusion facilitator family transporter n=1 Tax=Allomuricauda sp. d1 TaxID=3136725 RepID=UPI0031DC365E